MLRSTTIGLTVESATFFKWCMEPFEVSDFSEDEVKDLKSKFMRLSDTIAMWAHPCPPISQRASSVELERRSLLWLLTVAQHLLCKGFKQKRWALRGAISFGEAIQDISDGAIVGKPWAEAAGLEKDQQWSGIALHPSAASRLTEDLKTSGLIVGYRVPCKSGSLARWVIDWRDGSISASDVEDTFKLIGGDVGAGEQEKMKNTLDFLGAGRCS